MVVSFSRLRGGFASMPKRSHVQLSLRPLATTTLVLIDWCSPLKHSLFVNCTLTHIRRTLQNDCEKVKNSLTRHAPLVGPKIPFGWLSTLRVETVMTLFICTFINISL